jgi:hypothetical protein
MVTVGLMRGCFGMYVQAGKTPLIVAREKGHADVVKLIEGTSGGLEDGINPLVTSDDVPNKSKAVL